MKQLVILSAIIILYGCALTPEQIKSADTQTLCDHYGGFSRSDKDYLKPEIRDELVKRNASACTDPGLITAKQQRINQRKSAMAGFGLFMAVMGQPQPTHTVIVR